MLTPKVYVSTFKKYNNGSLKGAWLDLGDFDSEVEFIAAAKKLHSDEADPEIFFQAHENIPSQCIQETQVNWKYVDFYKNNPDIADHESAAAAFISVFGVDYLEEFENLFYSQEESKESFVLSYIDTIGLLNDIPESVAMYFDYDSYGRDIFLTTFHYVNGFVFNR
ncbi:antirestriction protein ArdA [Rosenbergiella collisarenosi]|uniref:antirestriction protein ArdA n=1 Tax=Rosenbergiella collisarenosi TaxID=1544695 RepID=UPI001F4D783B|nr:antirestriction protein ArdA [Rosenbergiella collisarenosi]